MDQQAESIQEPVYFTCSHHQIISTTDFCTLTIPPCMPNALRWCILFYLDIYLFYHHHHHHHVHEELGVFPVPWPSKWSWSLHLFFGRPMFLRPFGLYCSACFGILFLSILCTCCSYFLWYCFISFTMFCAPVFSLLHWFFSLSNFVIPSKCLKNFICAASKRCSYRFFSTQASLPNFNTALAVMLWILNFVSLFICFPKCLRITPFILLYVCNLSYKLEFVL